MFLKVNQSFITRIWSCIASEAIQVNLIILHYWPHPWHVKLIHGNCCCIKISFNSIPFKCVLFLLHEWGPVIHSFLARYWRIKLKSNCKLNVIPSTQKSGSQCIKYCQDIDQKWSILYLHKSNSSQVWILELLQQFLTPEWGTWTELLAVISK